MTRCAVLLMTSFLITGCGADGLPTAPSMPGSALTPVQDTVSGKSLAIVSVETFTVSSAPVVFPVSGVRISYIPRIRLKENSGATGILITSIDFHLDDIGATGNLPKWPVRKRIEAGGTRDLIEDVYGEAEFEMDSSLQTARVSVTITFIDDQQHLGSVSAVSDVMISQ